jgi:hypothetical protein
MPRHDADAVSPRLVVHGAPELLELLLGRLGRKVEIDREMPRLEPGDRDVAEHDVKAEPRRPRESERGHDEERIGRQRHDLGADPDHAVVDAVTRTDDDGVVGDAEPGIDDAVEELRMYLAEFRQLQRIHG